MIHPNIYFFFDPEDVVRLELEFELEREDETRLLEELFWVELFWLELFCELGRLSITAPRSVSILTFSRLYPRS